MPSATEKRAALRIAMDFIKAQRAPEDRGHLTDPMPHQVPPPQWKAKRRKTWLFKGGRGSGKTEAGARAVNDHALKNPGTRIMIVAPTLDDAVDTCVEGISGLRAINPTIRLTRPRRVRWPNGSQARLFGAYAPEDIQRFRGPAFAFAWLDELAAWRQLNPDNPEQNAWAALQMPVRMGKRPQIVITTTPKPRAVFKEILNDPEVEVTTATTNDNKFLSNEVRAEFYRRYEGTRYGRQELNAELLEDVEGAMWEWSWIEENRVPELKGHVEFEKFLETMERIVVGIDPAGSTGKSAHDTGIAVCGRGIDGDYYVFNAQGYRQSPKGWASRAINLYHEYSGDRIVAESNFGGDMVESTIRQVNEHVPVTLVRASRGKVLRAEPIAALYEQGHVHHVGTWERCEDQMTTFPVENEADDVLDAVVWAITELYDDPSAGAMILMPRML